MDDVDFVMDVPPNGIEDCDLALDSAIDGLNTAGSSSEVLSLIKFS